MTVADGSRSLKVGIMLPQTEGLRGPGVRSWKEINEMAVVAEQVGFDSVWLVDHLLYKLDGEDKARGVWEVWSLLSAIAATTSRVELGTLVLAMGWRNPALLAKMADTVEEISGGRLILGLGSGYHRFEYDAFGFPYNYKVSRFEEAIQIVHGLLRDGQVDFEGKYYSARECELLPRGPRDGGPPILIGSTSPRMMAAMAKYADCWNAYYDDTHNQVDGIRRLRPIIDAACREQGRDPATLERTVTVLMADSTADPWWDRLPSEQTEGQAPLVPLTGPAESIAEVLRQYEQEGIAHVQICLDPTTSDNIEKLAPILEALDAG
jgi:alkanesulfonate monooxygenase SsuD/methylene tetrahydromethanopterin reductase-like flavin-dependent oxidoreductase (luciferase family)